MEYLEPRFDARKSFYKKAKVYETAASTVLESYDTRICELYINGELWIFDAMYSQTTMRHVKEFLKQHNVKIDKLLKEYGYKNLTQLFKNEGRVIVEFYYILLKFAYLKNFAWDRRNTASYVA